MNPCAARVAADEIGASGHGRWAERLRTEHINQEQDQPHSHRNNEYNTRLLTNTVSTIRILKEIGTHEYEYSRSLVLMTHEYEYFHEYSSQDSMVYMWYVFPLPDYT